jgi:hypothetical protein
VESGFTAQDAQLVAHPRHATAVVHDQDELIEASEAFEQLECGDAVDELGIAEFLGGHANAAPSKVN